MANANKLWWVMHTDYPEDGACVVSADNEAEAEFKGQKELHLEDEDIEYVDAAPVTVEDVNRLLTHVEALTEILSKMGIEVKLKKDGTVSMKSDSVDLRKVVP